MVRPIRVVVLAAVCLVLTVGLRAGSDETIGAGVKLKDATPIKALYETPEQFLGKTIRLDGVVTEVCEEMGCWMALASSDNKKQVVRFKVNEGAGIVFPLKARGKKASAEGVFELIAAGDKDGHEAAHEHAAKEKEKEQTASDFGAKYQIKATGAVIR